MTTDRIEPPSGVHGLVRAITAAASPFLRAATTRRGMLWIGAGLVLVVLLALGGETLDRHLSAIEAWLGTLGTLGTMGTLALIPLYVLLTSLLFPDTVLRVAAGALFGLTWGVAGIALGTLLGSLVQYGLSQQVSSPIERLLVRRPTMHAMQQAVLREGFPLQLLIRLTPVNHAAVSYVLGAAGVRLGPFVLALPAVLPSIMLEVWIGHAGRHAVRAAGSSTASVSMSDLVSYAGLALGLLAMVLASRAAHRAVMRAMQDDQVSAD